MDRMGMEDPEQGVLPLDPFQVRVGQHAEEDEDSKQQSGQPQLPEEDDQDAGRCRSNRRTPPYRYYNKFAKTDPIAFRKTCDFR
jgi:hypothetical protein